MADNQNQDNENSNNEDSNKDLDKGQEENTNSPKDTSKSDSDLVNKIVEEKLAEALKDIKSKLDKAYGARDDALKKLADIEQEKKAAELKRLQDEGKHKEAYELQLAEERARAEALEKKNVELTRDIEIRDALKSYQFRNDNASDMAFKEIASQVVRNEQGLWVHRSGINIRDFVKTFSESDDNSFLFKPKTNSGAGSQSQKPTESSSSSKTSLFEMSQEEVLKLAREGKLRR
jgi:hypothetical protein